MCQSSDVCGPSAEGVLCPQPKTNENRGSDRVPYLLPRVVNDILRCRLGSGRSETGEGP